MSEFDPFLVLALVAILAFQAPFFSKALKLPIVVGEILFGVVVGTIIALLGEFGLEISLTSDVLEVLSTLGFIMLFLSGILTGVVLTAIYLWPDIIHKKDMNKDQAEKIDKILGEDLKK